MIIIDPKPSDMEHIISTYENNSSKPLGKIKKNLYIYIKKNHTFIIIQQWWQRTIYAST